MTIYTNTARDITTPPTVQNSLPVYAIGPTGAELISSTMLSDRTLTASKPSQGLMPTLRETSAHTKPNVQRSSALSPNAASIALELIEQLKSVSPVATTLAVNSLAGHLMQMWEAARHWSTYHQDLLAILENDVCAARDADTIDSAQLDAWREVLTYLSLPVLVSEHVSVVRSRFLRSCAPPLSFMRDGQPGDGDDL